MKSNQKQQKHQNCLELFLIICNPKLGIIYKKKVFLKIVAYFKEHLLLRLEKFAAPKRFSWLISCSIEPSSTVE